MKIGVSRPSATPEESHTVLATARRYGFAGVQLKPAQYEAFVTSPATFRDHYGALADLAQGGLIVYPGSDPAKWPASLALLLPFAAAIGAGHVCLCSGVYQTNATAEQVREVSRQLTAIGKSAQAVGLVISIHNHVDSLVETEDDLVRLLQMLDPEICGLTLDTAHAAKAGIQGVERLVRRFQSHLRNVHLKDLGSDENFCALGQGTVPLPPILATLRAIQYDEWLIVDEETPGLSTEEALRVAAEYLKDKI
jgi:sugar phosphate isomerase/epimerase